MSCAATGAFPFELERRWRDCDDCGGGAIFGTVAERDATATGGAGAVRPK